MKGIIALDIDGTITVDHHDISKQVVLFLESLANSDWQLIFLTGRTFKWGYEVLKHIKCSYYFAVQNGAIILEMPSRFIISKKYLDQSIMPIMDMACQGEPSHFVVYSGYEHHDLCYYIAKNFAPPMLTYVKKRKKTLNENWIEIDSFDELPIHEFASVKAFGNLDSALRIITKIEKKSGLHVPLIRDPFEKDCYVVQATHSLVNKGTAVKDLQKKLGSSTPIIAAGDDNNDRLMLAAANFKVVMATAPEDMFLTADVIAPPAAQNGIIEGLQRAIEKSGIK